MKLHPNRLGLLIGLMLICSVQPVYGLRCGGSIVSKGDTKFQVINKCGEPESIESWQEERIKRDFYYKHDPYRKGEGYREPFLAKEYIRMEEWTYNFGPTTFIRYLLFENSRLKKISDGEKGTY